MLVSPQSKAPFICPIPDLESKAHSVCLHGTHGADRTLGKLSVRDSDRSKAEVKRKKGKETVSFFPWGLKQHTLIPDKYHAIQEQRVKFSSNLTF